jgi:hypothetical protein
MHIISLGYPETPTEVEQEAASSFYRSLAVLIPCPRCREHYAQLIRQTPVAANSQRELVEWVWTIHNQVNEQLGRSPVSFEAFLEHMESLPAATAAAAGMPLTSGICIGIGVSALVYYMFLRR